MKINRKASKSDKLFRLFSSLALALLVWYSINGTTNSIVTRYITDIPVTFTNEEVLYEKGLSVDSNQIYFVNLELRGTDESLDAINTSEITAQIDLAQVDEPGIQKLEVIVSGLNNTVILDETVPEAITIDVSEITDITYTPIIITQGLPADGLQVISATTAEEISVSGLSNDLSRVDHISGIATIDGISQDTHQFVHVSAYDSEGVMLENVTCNPNIVDATILLGITKEVSVNPPEVRGNLDNDYRIVDIQVTPNEVTIAGKKEELDKINSINTNPVDLPETNQNQSFSTESSIIIPKGIILMNETPVVKVSVNIEQIIQRNYTISNLEIQNLGENLTVVRINPGSIIARFQGTASELSSIDASQLKGYINLNGYTEGTYIQTVNVVVNGVTLVSLTPESVEVEIQKTTE